MAGMEKRLTGGEDEGAERLSPFCALGEGGQHGDDAVLCDGLQEAGGPSERLHAGPDGGQQRPNQNDPLVGPRDASDGQFAANAVAKPAHN